MIATDNGILVERLLAGGVRKEGQTMTDSQPALCGGKGTGRALLVQATRQ